MKQVFLEVVIHVHRHKSCQNMLLHQPLSSGVTVKQIERKCVHDNLIIYKVILYLHQSQTSKSYQKTCTCSIANILRHQIQQKYLFLSCTSINNDFGETAWSQFGLADYR